jgi:hypothetical protein
LLNYSTLRLWNEFLVKSFEYLFPCWEFLYTFESCT